MKQNKIPNRRDEATMLALIMQVAKNDDRIRAVMMNGSRTSPSAKKDIFQDYDIVYIVTEVLPFVEDEHWIQQFGDILIMQLPDVMDEKWPKQQDEFAYLVQFKDWNRIDFTLLQTHRVSSMPRDSQSLILLDKDNLFPDMPAASDKDYMPKPPAAKTFADCCNEFLWVSTYVAKGLWRNELIYSKHMAEQVVKEQLIKLLTWAAAINTQYGVCLGKLGKRLDGHLDPALWQQFKQTYADANVENMWQALFVMYDLFHTLAKSIANYYRFALDDQEFATVLQYLHAVKSSAQNFTLD